MKIHAHVGPASILETAGFATLLHRVVDAQGMMIRAAELAGMTALRLRARAARIILSGAANAPPASKPKSHARWFALHSEPESQTLFSAPHPGPFSGITRTRRNLPHWSSDGSIYWVTFRLADSLPQDKLAVWRAERGVWLERHPEPWDDEAWREYDERFGQRLEAWLDAGAGECVLRRPEIRAEVERCLRHFDGERYDLGDWVIMPNHVHLLIRPGRGRVLSRILQGIKGVSARNCNALLGTTERKFWQEESYDHIVRSEAQLRHYIRYIADNPVKARLKPGEYSVAQTILSEPRAGGRWFRH